MRFARRTEIVDAIRWWLPDEHRAVVFYDPPGLPMERCPECTCHDYTHGRLGDEKICPGTWILTDQDGNVRSSKNTEFLKDYQRIQEIP